MKKITLFIAALMVLGISTAQNTDQPGTRPIPVNPDVKMGKLSNGITYYIQKNVEPANRMELRLAVNAGSMQETDEQQGLAHFCEHMAFNGTKNFKKLEIVDYLESIGTRFGAHLNAYTSFDETVYMLQAPTDDQQIIDKAFLILSDWANGVTFETDEIEKERGVVIEEWRLGQGANERMRKEWWPVAFKDSRYADRLPIGKKDILESFEPQLIRDFYKDWYRPDLMAVVAVGDFDVAQVEKLIKEKFSAIPAAKKAKKREIYTVPEQSGLRVAVASDKEARFAQVRMSYMLPSFTPVTLADYEKQIQIELLENMINARFAEYTTKPDAPFQYGFGSYGSQVRTRDQFTTMGITSADNVEACLRQLLLENKRILQHGFIDTELERAKTQYMTRVQSQMKEKDKTPSRNIVMEYVYHYLAGNPVPGVEFEYNFSKEKLGAISVETINKLVKEFMSSTDQIIIVTGPEKEGVEYPDETSINNLYKAVELIDVDPYIDQTNSAPLIANEPKAGSIVSEKKLEGYDAVEWTLSNGAKVIVKTTDFKNDEILFSAESKGGYSLHSESQMWSARNADGVIDEAGIGEFNQSDLRKKLTGKRLYIYPYIGPYEEGFAGQTSPDDLETFMQLLHLYFTNPRKDGEALEVYKNKRLTFIENQAKSPEGYFGLEVNKILSQNHPWAQMADKESLDKIQIDQCYTIFKQRFASPSDFTFFFVGNVQPDQLKGFVTKYLASIEKGTSGEEYKDLGIRPPKGVVKETVYKGSEPKSLVTISFNGNYKTGKFSSMAPKAVEKALSIKLRQALREDQGGTYGVGCRVSISEVPYSKYSVSIQFGCAPENVDKLVETTFSVIEELIKNGPTDEDMQKFKETAKREHEASQTQNRFWLNRLKNYAEKGEDATTPDEFNSKLNELSNKEVKKLAKKLLSTKSYVQVVLKPEE